MTAAVYAFVAWVSVIVAYIVFLIWTFTPEEVLHHYGITYYPDRYYALALPSYFMVTCIFVCFLYMGLNMMNTFDPDDRRTVEDSQSIKGPNDFVKLSKQNGYCVPDISDMDICAVTELMLPVNIRTHRAKLQRKYANQNR